MPTSREARGGEELARALDERGVGEAEALAEIEALRDREEGVERVAARGEELPAPLLAVDEDHEVLYDEAPLLEGLDRLELARPVGDDVVDHDDALARREVALDAPPGAVAL